MFIQTSGMAFQSFEISGSSQLDHYFAGMLSFEEADKRNHCVVNSSRHFLFVLQLPA